MPSLFLLQTKPKTENESLKMIKFKFWFNTSTEKQSFVNLDIDLVELFIFFQKYVTTKCPLHI